MKPPSPPKVAVAVTCTCGKKIVLEPRWVGKPTGCASCGRDFVVRMLWDPQTSRWSPSVNYTPTVAPEAVKAGKDGQANWVNVACECGHKIGLVGKFLGRNMTCNSCGREFIVRKSEGKDTAVIRVGKLKATAEVIDDKAKGDKPKPAPPKKEPPKETKEARDSKEPRDGKKMPEPPSEFHLLCTCGEELVVEKQFYNNKMYCAGCGALVELRLIFVPDRNRYELEARYLEAPQAPES